MLIALVVCLLTLSLATRFCNQVASQVHIAKALDRRGVELMRQRVTRNKMRVVAQVQCRFQTYCLLLASRFYRNFTGEEPLRRESLRSSYSPLPSLRFTRCQPSLVHRRCRWRNCALLRSENLGPSFERSC
jgi:hypothetical protein